MPDIVYLYQQNTYKVDTALVKIGNSFGIRIPKALIEVCHLDQELEFVITKKGLLIAPKVNSKGIPNPREGWAAQFEMAIAQGDKPDGDLFEGMRNKFDEEEWTW